MPRKVKVERLLDVATEVFERHGYDSTRVERDRPAGGCRSGHHLPLLRESNEQLYLTILERFAEALAGTSEGLSWAEIRAATDLRSLFSDLYTEIFELCARNRGVAGLLLGGPPVGDRSIQIRSLLIDEAEAISVAYLEAGAAAGLLRPVPTKPVARAIVGLLLQTVTSTIVAEGRTEDLRDLAEELLDFELHGLLATDPPGWAAASSISSANGPATT